MDIQERYQRALMVRERYARFTDYLVDAMAFLGFSTTWMQMDIGEYMQFGPKRSMVQAQRGEAKSTIAVIRSTWAWTQDPTERVLLISGSGDKADENAYLAWKLLTEWEVLAHLRPDKSAGDRTSVTEFDVHWSLKGLDKSPSMRTLGITASLQGYRASLLIADDKHHCRH